MSALNSLSELEKSLKQFYFNEFPYVQGDIRVNFFYEKAESFYDSIKDFSENEQLPIQQVVRNLLSRSKNKYLANLLVILEYLREKKGKNFGVALDDYFKSQILTKLLFKKTVLKENYLLLKWLYGMEKPPSEALIKRVTSGRKLETYFLLIGLRKVELYPNSKKHNIDFINRITIKFKREYTWRSDFKIDFDWPQFSLNDLPLFKKEALPFILKSKSKILKYFNNYSAEKILNKPYHYKGTNQSNHLIGFIDDVLVPVCECKKKRQLESIEIYDHLLKSHRKYYNEYTNKVFQIDWAKKYFLEKLKDYKPTKISVVLSINYVFQKYLKSISLFDYLNQIKGEKGCLSFYKEYSNEFIANCYSEKEDFNGSNNLLRKPYLSNEIRLLLFGALNTSVNFNEALLSALQNKITINELSYLFHNNFKGLFLLDENIRASKRFNLFLDTCLEEANGNKEYDFKSLFTLVIKYGSNSHKKQFLQLRDHTNGYFWESCCIERLYPRLIYDWIKAHDISLLGSYYKMEANRFLMNKESVKTLKKVLTGKLPVNSLKVSPKTYKYFIPFINKEYAKFPFKRTAFEMALSFSLADSQYLYYLCSFRNSLLKSHKPGYRYDSLYKTHLLPKKSGGNRTITTPEDRLKKLQARIHQEGFSKKKIHQCAHGFQKEKSVLTNALVHVGYKCVLNVDIKSFFPNTSYELIYKACYKSFHKTLSNEAIFVLADICSYAGGLPMGAPTSPMLANIILEDADASISKVCKRNNINYTRYADDLTFSNDEAPLGVLPFVQKVLKDKGYELDPKKTNIFRRGRRQMVTGLVVNAKPNIPKKIRKKIRAAVHHRSLNKQPTWHNKPISDQSLIGYLNWLKLVQPEESLRYKKILKKAKI